MSPRIGVTVRPRAPAARHYLPASMKTAIWPKGMAIISQCATELGCPTPLLSATMPIYAAAMAGLGGT
ncbi:MAG TPA: hypothetical protein VND19_18490 [Acetobacteraceae bacterium]|nr:hypothetical protein [Acetobacteraceae bacterium]